MSKIVIQNLGGKEVPLLGPAQTVLQLIQSAKIDWMFACGGKGRCTTCRFEVIEGSDNLTALTQPEERFRFKKELHDNERLACQAVPTGPVVIRVPVDCQLPHIKYLA
ncbi:MAG: (2Fe-2S)-binding protein [Cyclobacteriaceae bacterium]|nr:(2Fe-2S)-binding protein [Cyclobacteriaceae bacterium]